MTGKEEYPALAKFKVPIDNAQTTNMLLNEILRLKIANDNETRYSSKKSIESQSTINVLCGTIWKIRVIIVA